MKQVTADIMTNEVDKLPTMPTYTETKNILRMMEESEECRYEGLHERRMFELIGNVWKARKARYGK